VLFLLPLLHPQRVSVEDWRGATLGSRRKLALLESSKKGVVCMNDLDRFQVIQRQLLTAGFSSKLDVRREPDYAVIKLTVSLGNPDPEVTQALVDITTANDATFAVEHDQADVALLNPARVD